MNQTANFAVTTYALSGQVTTRSGAGLPGVVVGLSGSQTGSTSSDSSGSYQFLLPQGTYTVTPSLTGFSFAPGSQQLRLASNQSVNFQADAPNDFDGDGRADLLWQDTESGFAQIWYLGGPQGVTVTGAANLTKANPWRIVGIADFDGDGIPDVAWQDPATGAVQVWFMGGSGGNVLVSAANITAKNAWQVVSIADFNRDGHPDLLWEDPASGFAQIWYLGGAHGTDLLGAANLTKTNPWHIVGAADFNGDGFPDVVWQDPASGTIQIWYLGGSATGREGSQLQSAANLMASHSRVAAIADFNQDGHPDIVLQEAATGAASVYFFTGAQGTTANGSATISAANPWSIAAPK